MKTIHGASLSICNSIVTIINENVHREAISGDQNPRSHRISSIPRDSLIVLLQERMEDVVEDVEANRSSLLSMMISSPFLML